MKEYFTFDFKINYLIYALKILHTEEKNEMNMNFLYEYVLLTDIDTLKLYKIEKTIVPNSDLEIFIDIIDSLIFYYENIEDYEKCHRLKIKKIECQTMLDNKN